MSHNRRCPHEKQIRNGKTAEGKGQKMFCSEKRRKVKVKEGKCQADDCSMR